MALSRTLTGGDLKLYINNRPYGRATSIQYSIDSGRHPIRGIDTNLPIEYAEGPSTISGSIDVVRLRRDGGLEGSGITTFPHYQTLEKYISITVVDRVTDSIILQVDKAIVRTQSWRANPRSLVTGSFSFEGLSYVNESAV